MTNQVCIATMNRNKVREMRELLRGIDVELAFPSDFGIVKLANETGDTFLDNAVIKAVGVFSRTGIPTFADDSGLEVGALGGAPGVRSARYAGDNATDVENTARLLSELTGVVDRRARFVCTIALVAPTRQALVWERLDGVDVVDHTMAPAGTKVIVVKGETAGTILHEPLGLGGFGYDPVFLSDDLGVSFAQATMDAKNRVSHRGRAFAVLGKLLKMAAIL